MSGWIGITRGQRRWSGRQRVAACSFGRSKRQVSSAGGVIAGATCRLERVQQRPWRGLGSHSGGYSLGGRFGARLGSQHAVEDAGIAEVDFEFRRPRQRALNQRFRERIFDVLLQRAAQRTRAVTAVGAGLLEDVLRSFLREADLDLLRPPDSRSPAPPAGP